MSAGASPQIPLALPRSPSWFQVQGDASRQDGGEERKGLGGEGKGKGDRDGGKREKLGDGAMVVGGIDAPDRRSSICPFVCLSVRL